MTRVAWGLCLLTLVGCARIGDSFGGDGDDGSDVPDDVTEIPADAWTRLATARCEARSRCDCAEPLDMATCVDAYVAQLSEEVEGLDLDFSPACLEEILDFYAEIRCETGAQTLSFRPQCPLLAGDGREPCVLLSGLEGQGSTCSWSSQCHSDGVCRDGYPFLNSVEIGQPCTRDVAPGQESMPCDYEGYCDPTQYVCVPDVGIGEACPDATACSIEAYCAGPNASAPDTCQPRAKVGDACEPGSGYEGCETLCDDGGCAAIECVDGICQPPPPYVCLGPG